MACFQTLAPTTSSSDFGTITLFLLTLASKIELELYVGNKVIVKFKCGNLHKDLPTGFLHIVNSIT